MDAKKIALLVGALIVAALTAFMARSMFAGAATPPAAAVAPPPKVEGPEVLVATRALPVGAIIDRESFRYQPWPQDLVNDSAYFLKGNEPDAEKLFGSVVRNAITAGQPLTQGSIVQPGERGFLAAALGPGMRAVTVSVSQQSGVAGFVFPGDRVDLVLTQSVAGGGDGPPLKATETIMRNLRVLATDQRTNVVDDEGKPTVQPFATVTLETTPRIAEKIAVAQTIGQLSLSLRSMADNNAELERAIAAGEVSVPEGDDAKADKAVMLAVASRPIDTGATFVTGADVSRFQRRTVPAKRDDDRGPSGGGSTSFPGGSAPKGPMVTIARGNTITEVPVGGK